MDPRLRLQATLDDQASPKIQRIREELAKVKRTPQMEQTEKFFGELGKGARWARAGFSEFAGAIGAVSLGGVVAADTMAKVARELKNIGDKTTSLRELGRVSGLTADQIRQFELVGQKFHIAPERMDAAISTFASKMVLFNRQTGDLYTRMAKENPEIAKRMLGENFEQQFKDAIAYLTTAKNLAADPALQREWYTDFFGDPSLAQLSSKGLSGLMDAMKQAQGEAPKFSKELLDASEKFYQSVTSITTAFEALENIFAPTLLNQMAIGIDNLAGAIKELQKSPKDIAKDAVDAAKRQADTVLSNLDSLWPNTVGGQYLGQFMEWWRGGSKPAETPEPKTDWQPKDGSSKRLRHNFWMQEGDPEPTIENPNWKLFSPSAFHPGGDTTSRFGSSIFVDAIAAGTKAGTLEAFREWADEAVSRAAVGLDQDGQGKGFRLQKAAYTPGDGTYSGSGGAGSYRGTSGADLSGGSVTGEHADFIRQVAKELRIDPRVAVAVARSEGLGATHLGDHGLSGGDFQLFMGGGLGNIYKAQTGHDPRDPQYWQEQDRFALEYAAKHGWGDWHGAARIGVTGMMGIGGRPAAGADLSGADLKEAATAAGAIGPGAAVDKAMLMRGFGESQAAQALHRYMHHGEWCADFVNGALEASGVRGTKSALAASFSSWGKHVDFGDVQKGDVITERHGNRIGHVGMATGRKQLDELGRIRAIEMISGNYGHQVRTNWEGLGQIGDLRRSTQRFDAPAPVAQRPFIEDRADRAPRASLMDSVPEASFGGKHTINGALEAHLYLHGQSGAVRGVRSTTSGALKVAKVQRAPFPTEHNPDGGFGNG